jgi:predicted flap endonuclease-1-like 5' DNA nuclease/cytoskeletal protein CcmA (bactofilin family)
MLPACSTGKLTLSALVTLLLLALLLLVTPPLQAAGLLQSGQIFTSDLTVSADQTYEGDVTVTAGNVRVEAGGVIEGNVVVWSGNVEVQEGGEVGGDVSAFSGNVLVAGRVGGRIAALNGNIQLEETAAVDGDVSVMNGKILRARGAEIGGNVVEGPGFVMPKPFQGWTAPDAPQPPPQVTQTRTNFGQWLGWLILRLILAVIVTAIVVVLCVALFNLRPDLVQPLRPVLLEQTAFSFVVGLLVNLVLFFITSLLIGTLCLAPFAAAPALALLGLNLFGWTVAAQVVGERVSQYVRRAIRPIAQVALGALLLTGAVALLLALGGCFRPVAFLLWLLPASGGVGAALVHWLKLGRPTEPTQPVSTTPAPVAPAPTVSTPPVEPPPAEAPAVAQGEIPPAVEDSVPAAAALADMPLVAQVASQPSSPAAEDDFTVINGIGPTFDRRLKAANVRTFAQLAALTPEQIAEIIGWTPQRVIADDLIGQARVLAAK